MFNSQLRRWGRKGNAFRWRYVLAVGFFTADVCRALQTIHQDASLLFQRTAEQSQNLQKSVVLQFWWSCCFRLTIAEFNRHQRLFHCSFAANNSRWCCLKCCSSVSHPTAGFFHSTLPAGNSLSILKIIADSSADNPSYFCMIRAFAWSWMSLNRIRVIKWLDSYQYVTSASAAHVRIKIVTFVTLNCNNKEIFSGLHLLQLSG